METTTRRQIACESLTVSITDDDLIAGVVAGHEEALDGIYRRYHRLVYAVALRITRDHMVAEEVAQDVLHVVWQAAPAFRPGASLAAWLVGIARHRAIDATRSRRHRARAREELLDDERVPSAAGASDEHAETLMLRAVVRAALARLTPKQRQGIDLAYFRGLTHVEIAAHLGKPVGTIKSRIHLALERLRVMLGGMEEELAY